MKSQGDWLTQKLVGFIFACSFKKGNEQDRTCHRNQLKKAMISFQILRYNELYNSVIIIQLHILLQTSNLYSFFLNERIFFKLIVD